MGALIRTTLAIEKRMLGQFDRWMTKHGYSNRSEAMRDLIRSQLVASEWARPNARVIAVLSIIYDHESHTLAQELTHLQHADHHAILCTQHVHLDEHNCLEAIVMRGTARQIHRLADSIIATRGVRGGELSLLSKNL